eukprot:546702_1
MGNCLSSSSNRADGNRRQQIYGTERNKTYPNEPTNTSRLEHNGKTYRFQFRLYDSGPMCAGLMVELVSDDYIENSQFYYSQEYEISKNVECRKIKKDTLQFVAKNYSENKTVFTTLIEKGLIKIIDADGWKNDFVKMPICGLCIDADQIIAAKANQYNVVKKYSIRDANTYETVTIECPQYMDSPTVQQLKK